MQKVAIFGGTFDPVHFGHLSIAQTALTQLALERILWVPTSHPPHKSSRSLVEFVRRVEMVKLAIANNPAFAVSSVEIDRTGSSYAIQTFIELQNLYPDTQWYWIIGADAFQSLPKWPRWDKLATAVEWLVAPRLAHTMTAPSAEGKAGDGSLSDWSYSQTHLLCQEVANQLANSVVRLRWQILQSPLVAISSSLIRKCCRERVSIRHLVPETVRIYIEAESLYKQ